MALAAHSPVLWFALLGSACSSDQPADAGASGAGVAGQVAASGASATGGDVDAATSAGASAGGAVSASGGAPALAGAASASGGGGAAEANGGSGGVDNAAGGVGLAGAAGTGPMIPAGCVVSDPVSFKSDIGPWLNQSCGKGRGGGCHVTDDSSTVNSLCPDGTKKCGFNHAYDWITAGSHNEFCKQTPAPIRYTVVMDVLEQADPPTCTSTRVMPPDGPPVTACQKAALAAWLAEPKVLQVHRADDTSPPDPYLMPPFN